MQLAEFKGFQINIFRDEAVIPSLAYLPGPIISAELERQCERAGGVRDVCKYRIDSRYQAVVLLVFIPQAMKPLL